MLQNIRSKDVKQKPVRGAIVQYRSLQFAFGLDHMEFEELRQNMGSFGFCFAHAIRYNPKSPPSIFQHTWSLIIPPEMNLTGQKQIQISTIHSSAQKPGSSNLWRNCSTSRIVCCLAEARQQQCFNCVIDVLSVYVSSFPNSFLMPLISRPEYKLPRV